MTSDDVDDASMQMEQDEISDREESVRAMAPELATSLRMAMRWLVNLSDKVPECHLGRFLEDYAVINSTHEKLIERED